ncbi:unnamed protein product [Ilex paraguariensis]|uniref:Uncharacterized protein n=1 Tax=Ilex paraguariensis TaxID=185542 RepID=A0ABC8RDE7_9AQUA
MTPANEIQILNPDYINLFTPGSNPSSISLMILACSYQKPPSQSSDTEVEEKPAKPVPVMQPEMEPKIVVIMAGDDNPRYLAKPVLPTRHSEQV